MNMTINLADKAPREDRVRARTRSEINHDLDRQLEQRLRFYAVQDKQAITERIAQLDREWDIERTLEANAASVTLLGFFLGLTAGRKWFVLPLIAGGFLLNHAVRGWCPPLPVFRRLGVRTRLEIEQERYALKILRGDFDHSLQSDGKIDVDELVRDLRANAV